MKAYKVIHTKKNTVSLADFVKDYKMMANKTLKNLLSLCNCQWEFEDSKQEKSYYIHICSYLKHKKKKR